MNDLTRRFMKFRATPKAVPPPELHGPPCPRQFRHRPNYEPGPIPADETPLQKYERLSDAKLAGFQLNSFEYTYVRYFSNGHWKYEGAKTRAGFSEKRMQRELSKGPKPQGNFQ